MKILVVDDEKTIVKGIKFNLENEGYQVDVCYDGETAVDMARHGEYAVILLDLMMPKLDGLGACQRIRQFSTVPIIMLTARSEDADKLIGFESGADDYITKPFNILELKARIRALIRRSSMAPAAPAEPDSGKLVRGHIEIDPERRSAHRFGQNVELTLKEFELLLFLVRNKNIALYRETIYENIWQNEYMGDGRTVDLHIQRLRKKLHWEDKIKTVYKVGYRLEVDIAGI